MQTSTVPALIYSWFANCLHNHEDMTREQEVEFVIPTLSHMRMFAPGSHLGSVAKCHEKDQSRDF